MQHKTIYGKSTRGGHEARTLVPMGPVTTHEGPGERVLTLHTYKGSRGLLTHASVCVEVATASIHALHGDYSKRVLLTSARATEKAVKVQHDAVVGAQLHTVYAEAVAFYQAKDEKNPKPAPLPEPGKFDDTHVAGFDADATDILPGGFKDAAERHDSEQAIVSAESASEQLGEDAAARHGRVQEAMTEA